jgi:hypothetical protein
MLDGWTDSDLMGCWTDVYDDDRQEMQPCEANTDPRSALGLCAEHNRHQLSVVVGQPVSGLNETTYRPESPMTANRS